jgi:hypothetical protein
MTHEAKNYLLLTLLAFALSASLFAGIQTVKASTYVMVDQPWNRIIGINQSTEFIATGNGGTPPYTFQWYTTFLDPNVPPQQWRTVAVSGDNSAAFQFSASTPGRYGISIRVNDSKGEGEYQSFQPIGIVVTVQLTPVTQPSSSPSPTASPLNAPPQSQPNETSTEQTPQNSSVPQSFPIVETALFLVIIVVVVIAAVAAAKKSQALN